MRVSAGGCFVVRCPLSDASGQMDQRSQQRAARTTQCARRRPPWRRSTGSGAFPPMIRRCAIAHHRAPPEPESYWLGRLAPPATRWVPRPSNRAARRAPTRGPVPLPRPRRRQTWMPPCSSPAGGVQPWRPRPQRCTERARCLGGPAHRGSGGNRCGTLLARRHQLGRSPWSRQRRQLRRGMPCGGEPGVPGSTGGKRTGPEA